MNGPIPRQARNLIIALLGIVLMALLAPTPFWTEASSQSCHLCRARRVLKNHYRWWQLAVTQEQWAAGSPAPVDHRHDWWEYSRTHNSWSMKWAADKASTYRDGRHTWTPRAAYPPRPAPTEN